jgi:hypothetical protein
MSTTKPKFKHDCKTCNYLGHYFGHDIYVCGSMSAIGPSIIARYGNEDWQYASLPVSCFWLGRRPADEASSVATAKGSRCTIANGCFRNTASRARKP